MFYGENIGCWIVVLFLIFWWFIKGVGFYILIVLLFEALVIMDGICGF